MTLASKGFQDAFSRQMARALVVDPVDGDAEAFYARYGFERIPGLERMFVPLSQSGK